MSKIGEFEGISTDIPTATLQLIELGKELINTLQGTSDGFEEQGRLTKKLAIRIFIRKAKRPIEEWIQFSKFIVPELKKLIAAIDKGELTAQSELMLNISKAKLSLMDLKNYYTSTAQMVKKFFKGDELKEKLEGIIDSEQNISLFIQAIEFFEKKIR